MEASKNEKTLCHGGYVFRRECTGRVCRHAAGLGRLTGIEVVLAHRRLPAGAGARDLEDNRVIINYDLRLW